LGEWGNIKHTFYLFIYSHGIKQPAQEKVVGVNEAQQFLIYIYIKKRIDSKHAAEMLELFI